MSYVDLGLTLGSSFEDRKNTPTSVKQAFIDKAKNTDAYKKFVEGSN